MLHYDIFISIMSSVCMLLLSEVIFYSKGICLKTDTELVSEGETEIKLRESTTCYT